MCPKVIASLLYAILGLKGFKETLYFQMAEKTCIAGHKHSVVKAKRAFSWAVA